MRGNINLFNADFGMENVVLIYLLAACMKNLKKRTKVFRLTYLCYIT